jgi:hypothetical protein
MIRMRGVCLLALVGVDSAFGNDLGNALHRLGGLGLVVLLRCFGFVCTYVHLFAGRM